MKPIIPTKLKPGDMVRVIAPSKSLLIISPQNRQLASARLKKLGFKLSFGRHTKEKDGSDSASIASRIDDLHQAFADKNVKMVMAAIGGYNANELLDGINWQLIRKNPKIFVGFSDNTVISTAFLVKANLISYSGPNFADFGQKKYFDYTQEYFEACLTKKGPLSLEPSSYWTDDLWYLNQDLRRQVKNSGPRIITPGEAEGIIIGGSLSSLSLLCGTKYFPNLTNKILFLEEDEETTPEIFERRLVALTQQPNFNRVKTVIFGRFQNKSRLTYPTLTQIVSKIPGLKRLPSACNFDFGHTNPKFTFPIGGTAKIKLSGQKASLTLQRY